MDRVTSNYIVTEETKIRELRNMRIEAVKSY